MASFPSEAGFMEPVSSLVGNDYLTECRTDTGGLSFLVAASDSKTDADIGFNVGRLYFDLAGDVGASLPQKERLS